MLEKLLERRNRPTMQEHNRMGPQEWFRTAASLSDSSSFWTNTFKNIGQIIQMFHDSNPWI